MANTTNLNLVKPAGTDYALVSVINGNMDIIDSKVGAIPANESAQSQITALNNQIANKIKYTNYTMTEDKAIAANSGTEIVAMGSVIPSGARFISATLYSQQVSGLATSLFIHQTYWGGTPYLAAKNVSTVERTIPKDMVIQVVYMMD